jgi:hypothetical protein
VMLPELKAAGVLEEITYGPGAYDRFKLGVPMAVIAAAIAESRGSYEECLRLIERRKGR